VADHPVVALTQGYKERLAADEGRVVDDMTRRWLEMEGRLSSSMGAAAFAAAELRGKVTRRRLLGESEVRELLAAVDGETSEYIDYAARLVEGRQREYVGQAKEDVRRAIGAVYQGGGEIGGYWDEPGLGAMEKMIGFTGDGSKLSVYLRGIYSAGVDGLLKALLDGLSKGLNPREVAQLMMEGFGVGINRALNTARTEMLNAYREATRQGYEESGVVEGYKRLATHDGRVCAACILADGRRYTLQTQFEEHNQGRCALVPIVAGMPEIEWDYGRDWFLRQGELMQIDILGAGVFEAWQTGSFDLMDLVKLVRDAVWGDALVPRPLGELLGG